jgi:hypothetical protein
LPCVQEAIDETHIAIKKPLGAYVIYYYNFKIKCSNIIAQSIVDSNKKFIDLYVHLHGPTNDSCVLKKSTLYKCM